MAEVVQVTPEVAIPLEEIELRASRSSGPGGQGVNTTDSRVELRFDLAGSPSIPPEAKQRALRRLASRADAAERGLHRPPGGVQASPLDYQAAAPAATPRPWGVTLRR